MSMLWTVACLVQISLDAPRCSQTYWLLRSANITRSCRCWTSNYQSFITINFKKRSIGIRHTIYGLLIKSHVVSHTTSTIALCSHGCVFGLSPWQSRSQEVSIAIKVFASRDSSVLLYAILKRWLLTLQFHKVCAGRDGSPSLCFMYMA